MADSLYKEFKFPDLEPEFAEDGWEDTYSVLRYDETYGIDANNPWASRSYRINVHEGAALSVGAHEVDRYIEIFNWIKQDYADNPPPVHEPEPAKDTQAEQAVTDDADS
jgi:hypothetical protein